MPSPPRTRHWLLIGSILVLAAVVAWGVKALLPRHDADTHAGGPSSPPVAIKTGVLELTKMVAYGETIERTDRLDWWFINFGTTVSRIQVDATYRYHASLDPRGWYLRRVGEAFHVIVPPVRPSLPVAIDTSTLKTYSGAGWARFNKQENLEALTRSVSAVLAQRATTPAYIDYQREQARQAAADFARHWILQQERWKDVKPPQVRVFFSDEPIERLDVWSWGGG
jgi:hypothetical protein